MISLGMREMPRRSVHRIDLARRTFERLRGTGSERGPVSVCAASLVRQPHCCVKDNEGTRRQARAYKGRKRNVGLVRGCGRIERNGTCFDGVLPPVGACHRHALDRPKKGCDLCRTYNLRILR